MSERDGSTKDPLLLTAYHFFFVLEQISMCYMQMR